MRGVLPPWPLVGSAAVNASASPIVSVVVPVRNARATLEKCLEALLGQDYPPDRNEIILVDNGSVDGSTRVGGGLKRVRWLSEPSPGAYAARNRGAFCARGDVIAFIDADCIAHPGWLSGIAASFRDPDAAVLLGHRRLPGGRLLALIEAYESTKDRTVLEGTDTELYYGYTNNMAVRRAVFEELGPFADLFRGSDTVFVRKVAEHASTDAVRYRAELVVTHLEVKGLLAYYYKVFLYGRHRTRGDSVKRARCLDTRQRMTIYRQAVTAARLGPVSSALLLTILLGGLLMWKSGRLSSAVG